MMTQDELLATSSTTNSPKKRRGAWVSIIALIAILIAIGCWFQLVHQQKKTTNNYSQLQSSFHQTLTDTAQLTQAITDLQTALAAQNNLIQALSATVNRMQASDSGYELDLALQLTDRYIQQAYLSLTFNHDLPSAIILLQTADQRLGAVMDSRTIVLRRNIADAIVKLQAIPTIDNVGILSKLAALRNQVATIPLFSINAQTSIFHEHNNDTIPTNYATMGALHKAWFKTLENLKALVIIRNRTTSITPLISSVQEQFLRENLQLMLQQAQWAVLQRNQGVYQFSLNQANEWIQRYFSDNDQATQSLVKDINELKKIDLTPSTPDLKSLIDQIHNLQIQTNKSRTLQTSKVASSKAIKTINTEDESQETLAPPAQLPLKTSTNPKGEVL